MADINITKRYRVKEDCLCDCCKENQAIWFELPIKGDFDFKYFMCLICMDLHCTQGREKVEYHEEYNFTEEAIMQEEEDFQTMDEINNDSDGILDSDHSEKDFEEEIITDHFTIGNFTIFEVNASKWEFAKGICCLGGCDTNIVSFSDRNEAISEAKRLTNEGIEPEVGNPCSDCTQDYY
ncbi:hypothetical protein [Paenibacillus glucanolyticus]|uniref:hypothetical protein n=1 Tax=Paenibacillus glucanolyticus TaxID=59843 RepID=UPI00096C4C8C|nr:hypothetical protein [Paenibacillus glucanolyticus]OMF76712.1 hypothetical protein BK142_14420 [Paenibacillus glucanolyticus]